LRQDLTVSPNVIPSLCTFMRPISFQLPRLIDPLDLFFSSHPSKNSKATSRGRVVAHELHGPFIKPRVEMCRGTGYLETLAEMRIANDRVSVRGIFTLAQTLLIFCLLMTSLEAFQHIIYLATRGVTRKT
jgi:hypothetical protein